MVTIKEKGILENIIIHCERIETKTAVITYVEYLNNQDYCDLICFHILQIGELVKHFESEFVKTYTNVPWSDIAKMRDKVAHGYGTIKKDKVWGVAVNDIPKLNEYCKQILEENK